MITPEYIQMMAQYNTWQNQSLYGAADSLDQDARDLDRGAFFGSIQRTLSHILWGDKIWMSRFDGWEAPKLSSQSLPEVECGWGILKAVRLRDDTRIEEWSNKVVQADIEGELSWYSGAIKCEITRPRAMLITQLFNHQTHHRGQVHAMLTAAGASPDDTDIPFQNKH